MGRPVPAARRAGFAPLVPRAMLCVSPEEANMAGRDKTGTAPVDDGKPTTQPLPPLKKSDDDDYEDGDIATPKRDRYGTDDEPLE